MKHHSVRIVVAVICMLPACRCDEVDSYAPKGALEPAVLDLGPIAKGQTCTLKVGVHNTGRTDLHVDKASLTDTDGDYTLKTAPYLVKLGATENIVIDYTAAGDVGALESTGVRLETDDPRNEGILNGTITAVVAEGTASIAKAFCGEADALCADLSFGAVQLNSAGLLLTVTLKNDGTAPLTVNAAAINDGSPQFVVESVRRGTTLVTLPTVLPAGRTENCGERTTEDNTLLVDVRFVPTVLGVVSDTLAIASDALVGNDLRIPLSGVGSDVGIVTTPAQVAFGEVPEGEERAVDVLVMNVGTSEARVDTACIDLENDGTCEGNCTGFDADTALGGTLSCRVTKSNGDRESYGFALDPTDAETGGDDERTVVLNWAPTAGNTTMPAGAVLALKSNILGNRVFTVPLRGGAQGTLSVAMATPATCPAGASACISAAGDAADSTTWTGSVDLVLHNTGEVSLTLGDVGFDNATAATVLDDFTISAPSDNTLAPDESVQVTVSYANNDASQVDNINVVIAHDGVDAPTVLPLTIIAPVAP